MLQMIEELMLLGNRFKILLALKASHLGKFLCFAL